MQPENYPYNQPQPNGVPQPVSDAGNFPMQPGQQPLAQGYANQQPQPMPQVPVQGYPNQPMQQAPFNANSPQTAAAKPVPQNPNSTQSTLELSEIRDGIVIMADGSYRAVVACKSINFDLMSNREREGIEYSYQNFLNSLNFPVQILVRSQRVDIGPYIDKLVDTRRAQDNMLLGVLMDDYINFIDALSQEANIMQKSFYIVIPYFPGGDTANLVEQGKGFFGKLFAKPKNAVTHIDASTYQKAKDEIKNRVDSVIAGLFQMGIQSGQLNTKSLGELYYNYYNPDTALRQPLGNFDNVATTFVKKAPGSSPNGGIL